jgi:hypothetical protein
MPVEISGLLEVALGMLCIISLSAGLVFVVGFITEKLIRSKKQNKI